MNTFLPYSNRYGALSNLIHQIHPNSAMSLNYCPPSTADTPLVPQIIEHCLTNTNFTIIAPKTSVHNQNYTLIITPKYAMNAVSSNNTAPSLAQLGHHKIEHNIQPCPVSRGRTLPCQTHESQ